MIEVLRRPQGRQGRGRRRPRCPDQPGDREDPGRLREQARIGITANYGRRTGKGGKHPAWVLAQRFLDKIDMVLHHLTDFTVPWTSNLAEQALRHVKIHLKISGCFRSLITTRAYCRIHSYLITIRLNARPAHAGHPRRP